MFILGCSDEVRSFNDSFFFSFIILDFVKFNCFFTIKQIAELVFSIKDKQGSSSFSGFFFYAYARACSKGDFPVCFLTP